MKSLASRIAIAAVLVLATWMALAGATAPKTHGLEADKLVILTTTDVKAKTSPCG